MAFDPIERSVFGGNPVELFEFTILGDAWRYTTDDRVTVFNNADFEPTSGLSRSSIKLTSQIERSAINVRMKGRTGITDQFRVAPPSEPVGLRIYKKHRNDPDFIVRWRGRVQACMWEGEYATLVCAPINSTLKQPGLRLSYQYQCPHVLYDTRCRVNRSAFELVRNVSSVSGLTVNFAGLSAADNWFAGGYLLWSNETGRQETRMITASSGGSVTVQLTTIGLTPGDSVRLYPGCDHTIDTCYAKFNNANNYGGFPLIPKANPFAGHTIY